jgi:putative ABC transport system permease protein
MAALGIGVMFTLSVVLIQRSMMDEIFRSAPPGMPNVFVINITDRERAGLLQLLAQQRGIERPLEVVAAVPARLASVDGIPVEKLPIQRRGRRFLRTRSITWAEGKPAYTEVLKGEWWKPGQVRGPQVSVAEEAAGILQIGPGSVISFTSSGRTITAQVASVHRTESVRPGASIEFIFTPGALEGLPAIYYGGMRVRAADVPALQRAAYQRYPTVTVVNAADVLEIIQEVIDHVAVVVRFVSFFAILAGAVVLASSVAATQFRRVREIALLKALGASRGRVAAVFSIEFSVLGALAGVMGSLLGIAFSGLLLRQFFETGFRLDLLPPVIAVVATALTATAGAWLAGYRFLSLKPLEVLRNE